MVGEGAGVPVRIDLVEELGSDSFAYGTADLGDRTASVSVRLANRDAAVVGATLHITVAQESAHLFDSVDTEFDSTGSQPGAPLARLP